MGFKTKKEKCEHRGMLFLQFFVEHKDGLMFTEEEDKKRESVRKGGREGGRCTQEYHLDVAVSNIVHFVHLRL